MSIAPLAACPAPDAAPPPKDRLKEAAEGFETLFVAQLLSAARSARLSDDLGGSAALETSQQMLDSHMAEASAGQTHFGIAEALLRQFRHGEPPCR